MKGKLHKSGKRDMSDMTVSVRGEQKAKKRKDVDEGKNGKSGDRSGKKSKKNR